MRVNETRNNEKLDIIISLLEEILRWIKATNKSSIKELLLRLLSSDEEKIAYEFSDGERSSRDVAKLAGIDHVTVARWWRRWIEEGIAESISVRGGKRAKRVFSLEEFGITVPTPKQSSTEEEKEKNSLQ